MFDLLSSSRWISQVFPVRSVQINPNRSRISWSIEASHLCHHQWCDEYCFPIGLTCRYDGYYCFKLSDHWWLTVFSIREFEGWCEEGRTSLFGSKLVLWISHFLVLKLPDRFSVRPPPPSDQNRSHGVIVQLHSSRAWLGIPRGLSPISMTSSCKWQSSPYLTRPRWNLRIKNVLHCLLLNDTTCAVLVSTLEVCHRYKTVTIIARDNNCPSESCCLHLVKIWWL